MSPIRAIVFDLDDTLYPERQYAFSGFGAVAAAFSAILGDSRRTADEMRLLFDTEHRPRVFNELLRRRGRTEDSGLIQSMIEAYRRHEPTIILFPDADAALKRLRGRYKLGLLTDGPAIMQRAKVAALGLTDKLDAIILTDELGSGFGKPSPRAFELMAERLGVVPASCVYVADNAGKDFVAPNTLGWTTVQIRREGGVYLNQSPVVGGTPHHVIESLNQLDDLL